MYVARAKEKGGDRRKRGVGDGKKRRMEMWDGEVDCDGGREMGKGMDNELVDQADGDLPSSTRFEAQF